MADISDWDIEGFKGIDVKLLYIPLRNSGIYWLQSHFDISVLFKILQDTTVVGRTFNFRLNLFILLHVVRIRNHTEFSENAYGVINSTDCMHACINWEDWINLWLLLSETWCLRL